MHTVHAVITIAYRDFLKFARDRGRIFGSLIFPLIFIGILGGSMNSSLGAKIGYDFLVYVFVGVISQTMFQSSALGLISLIDDRENDFSQEIFVAPISRYAIVFGKILGESAVSLAQGLGVLLFVPLMGVRLTVASMLALLPAAIAGCLLGGAFGLLILVNLKSRRGAEQVFPLVLLPQFFLAGVMNPIRELNFPINVLSYISPMRYSVDLARGLFYGASAPYGADYPEVVLASPAFNLVVMTAIFAVCLVVGTVRFVRSERNR